MLVRGYEQEKAELEAKAETLKDEIANRQDTLLNAERFRKLVDKYTDITELMPELVREFVERIEVHERSGRYKKKHYTQQVDIYSISSARHDKAAPGCRNILGPCVEPKTSLSGRANMARRVLFCRLISPRLRWGRGRSTRCSCSSGRS